MEKDHRLRKLFKQEYEEIAKRLYKAGTKTELVESIEFDYLSNYKTNKHYWIRLSEVFNAKCLQFEVEEEESYSIILDLNGRDQFMSNKEKQVFISNFLFEKVDEYNKLNSLTKRKFAIKDLPKIEERLLEIDKKEGKRVLFYASEFNLLLDRLINLAVRGSFETIDVEENCRIEALKVLVKYYFTIACEKEEDVNRDRVVVYELSNEGNKIAFQRIIATSMAKDSKEIFCRGHDQYVRNNEGRNSGFSIFRKEETARWKEIKKRFKVGDSEYEILERYLKNINKFTDALIKKYSKVEKCFGINRNEHFEKLVELLTELTDSINFIYVGEEDTKKRIIREAAILLTSSNYGDLKTKIFFRCETTTAAYILDILNRKLGNRKQLNSYAIGKSKRFYITKASIPSEIVGNISYGDFKLLTRSNVAQSLGRFKKNILNKNRPEYHYYDRIKAILKRLNLI